MIEGDVFCVPQKLVSTEVVREGCWVLMMPLFPCLIKVLSFYLGPGRLLHVRSLKLTTQYNSSAFSQKNHVSPQGRYADLFVFVSRIGHSKALGVITHIGTCASFLFFLGLLLLVTNVIRNHLRRIAESV
ncbi:hypothetical protein FRC18_001446 [Serendipita sp. 400]|nr:hypothetical protein FRC18_001446 [Serendipita sp. 400]